MRGVNLECLTSNGEEKTGPGRFKLQVGNGVFMCNFASPPPLPCSIFLYYTLSPILFLFKEAEGKHDVCIQAAGASLSWHLDCAPSAPVLCTLCSCVVHAVLLRCEMRVCTSIRALNALSRAKGDKGKEGKKGFKKPAISC